MRSHAPSIATAALLLVALAGCQPSAGSSDGGRPKPTAPSVAPVASPVAASAPATAGYPSWYMPETGSGGSGILAVGSHATRSFVPAFGFVVPAGWVNDADSTGFFSLFPDTPDNAAAYAATGSLANGIHMGLMDNPYFLCQSLESNRGTTAGEMVAALEANDALATKAVDVTIGGLSGTQVDVQLDPSFTGGCPGDPPTLDLKDVRVRGLLLDVPDRGVLVVFVTSGHAADHEAFLAEAMPIVGSFEFAMGQ